jgi:hypothetical protein
MLFTLLMVSVCSWQSAWAQESNPVKVTVTLTESGSLSQEVLAYLANTLHMSEGRLSDVNELTIASGTLDAEDWTALQQMSGLQLLNINNITNTEIPESQFNSSYGHNLNLQTITLPKKLKSIGEAAFNENSHINAITLPESLLSIGESAFKGCSNLQSINWPGSVKTIPTYCFENCEKLEPFQIPEGVTTIGYRAFNECFLFTSTLPSSLKTIEDRAFGGCKMQDIEVTITDDMTIGNNVFDGTNIKSIDFATKYYRFDMTNYELTDCKNLKDVYFRSPTVVIPSFSMFSYYNEDPLPNIHVPAYLKSSYAGHQFWAKFTIVDFPDTDVNHYIVQDNLELKGSMRIDGEPNMSFNRDANFAIKGEAAQALGNISLSANTWRSFWFGEEWINDYQWTQIISESNNVSFSVTGDLTYRIYTPEKKWVFISLPFDYKVKNITTENGVKYAIRYYDGQRRAENNTNTGNWKDYGEDNVVKAGTGFIIQTSQATIVTFKAEANSSRNNAFNATIIKKDLTVHNGEETTSANKSWNFVGNPWQCYYNIHRMNYTAPISVYDDNYETYNAYSPLDDDYALRPNQAFFVQCPDEVEYIGFPIEGRQLTDEIVGQNGSRGTDVTRQLFDIQIANGDLKDKTRLVVNEKALIAYEINRDAGKMMADGSECPQIYSLDAEGNQYAINERPADDGILRLGILFAKDGEYTLAAIRNNIGQVILTDNETGIKTDLQENGYTFSAKKGTCEGRFTLSFNGGDMTAIQHAKVATSETTEVFTLDGQRLGNTTYGLKKGVYVVRQGQKTQKVIIK